MSKATKIIGGIFIIIMLVILLYGVWYASYKTRQAKQQTNEAGQIVRIGWIGPLTGDLASYGESIKLAIELARKDIDLDAEVIYEDSKCDGKGAVSAINKLISIDKVAAIIGDMCSSATLAAAPVAEQSHVVLISAASTSPGISGAGDYIFRVVPSDALQGDFAAGLVYRRGFRKLAVLYSNEDYGSGFNKVLSEKFAALGGKVVAAETFELTAKDMRTQLTKIKAASPDAIYIIAGNPTPAVVVLKQIKELSIPAEIFGAEGLKSPDILSGAGQSADGLIISAVSSGSTDFIAKYKQAYNRDPGPFAAQGYDAFAALARVIQASATTGEQIKDALYKLDFAGASGRIKFDSNGDVSGNYDVYVVKNGQFVLSEERGSE